MSEEEYTRRYILGNEKPACEYVDGLLIPKSMGSEDHGIVAMNLGYLIKTYFRKQFKVTAEMHVWPQPRHYRIPDVSVIDRARPIKGRYPGPGNPCFLCIEIKSPDDTIQQLASKCREEYHPWGVAYCWIFDPETRQAWEYFNTDGNEREVFWQITAGPITMRLDDIFEDVSA
jgi:Uma2 family endonuclease